MTTGFKPNSGVDDAFVTVETLVSKSLEWNFDVWCASLDLKKAFDRIEHAALFNAMSAHGVPAPYLNLIAELYQEQTGWIKGGRYLLFNVG